MTALHLSGDVLYIDMETRSAVDLQEAGAWRYAEDDSTTILCMAYAFGGGAVEIIRDTWLLPSVIVQHLAAGGRVEAHNALFEEALWWNVGVLKWGWPIIKPEQWRDSMATVAYAGYPLSLDKAAKALGLDEQKDTAGRRVMLKWCKPLPERRMKRLMTERETALALISEGRPNGPEAAELAASFKADPIYDPANATGPLHWADDAAEFDILCEYCRQDVKTERAIAHAVGPLPESEEEIRQMTARMNRQGLPIDLAGVNRLRDGLAAAWQSWDARVRAATGGALTADDLTAPTRLRAWLEMRGIPLEKLRKAELAALSDGDLPPDVRIVIEGRAAVGRASTKKLDAMERATCRDGRLRGSLVYHGAHTGRWAGRLIQPQNLPKVQVDDVDDCLADMSAMLPGRADLFELLWGEPYNAAAGSIRGMIAAPLGQVLVCADYSAIEARFLAWLADETWRLDVFRTHGKIYEASAAMMFGVPLGSIKKGSKERDKGKVAELALGYQGSVNALLAMGAAEMGIAEADLKPIVDAWRQASPRIVGYWRGVERAALRAMREPEKAVAVGVGDRVAFRLRKEIVNGRDVLRCRLPSGRCIAYPEPQIRVEDGKFGVRSVLSYMGVHPKTKQWCRMDTYGGKLVENIVQGGSRDLIAGGMLAAERAGFPPVLSVHDEGGAEVPANQADVAKFEALLATLPAWAEGLPLKAEGFASRRYRK